MPPRKVLDQTTFDELTTAFRSKNYKERRDAVNTLAKYRDPRARAFLIRALKDPTVTVRRRVVAALTKYRDPALIPHILVLLKDKTCRSHRLINKTILEFGLDAETYLLDALNDTNRQVRCAVAPLLAEIGSKRAVEPLLALIDPQSHDDSVFLIYALGKLRDSRALDPLLALLQNDKANAEVRRSAALALTSFADSRITDAYFALLKSELPLLRAVAFRCLANRKLSAEIGIPLLFSGIDDPDPQVIFQAFRGLERFADDPDVVERMLNLFSQSVEGRWRPIDVLGYSHDPRAVNVLIELLKDSDAQMRLHVLDALTQLRETRSMEPIIAMLRDPNAEIQRRAEAALRHLNDPRGLAALEAQRAEPVAVSE
jgi:HEAT repeat protein